MEKKILFINRLRELRPEVDSLVTPWKDMGLNKQTWHNITRGSCPQGEIAETIRVYFGIMPLALPPSLSIPAVQLLHVNLSQTSRPRHVLDKSA